jgi:hypothetical protein
MTASANSLLDQIIIFLATNNLVLGYSLITVLLVITFMISMKIAISHNSAKKDLTPMVDFNNNVTGASLKKNLHSL